MEESTLANQFTTGKISEEEFNQKRQQMRENYTANSAKLLGEKGPQLEFALKQRDSKLTSAWLTGMGKTDPTSALNKLDEFVAKDQIMAADAMKLRSDLEGSQVMVSTRVESDRAINTVRKSMQDDPNAAVPTMDEVRAKAFDSLPDNIKNDPVRGPLALEITSRRVASDYMDLMKGKVQAQQNTVQYLSGLLHPKDGPPITKEEQMYAAKPDAEAMYNSLPNEGPWSKKTVRGIMLDNLRGANRHDPLESGQMVSDFKGQADRGGESAMALLGVNPWDPKLPLNVNDRRRLEGIRNSIKDNPAGNNEVQKVFNTLKQNFRQEMTDLHIIGRTIHDDTVNRTYGAIGAAYEDFVTTHKGLKPTEKDIVEMGKEILRHSAGSMLPGWLGGTPAEPAMVEREPPADWVKGYVDKKTQEDGVAPTSDQIYHDYQLGLWDLIHQGRTRTSPVPQARPEPVAGPAQGTQGLPTVPTSR